MTSTWLVSDSLAELLGGDVLAQLDDIDPLSALTCQVCGRAKPTGDPGPMAVIAAVTDEGAIVVGLAHPACRDRVGDLWPELLSRIDSEDGVDATALFALRAAPRPRAVLAFEPRMYGREMLPTGDGIDPYVAAHLAAGFTLMATPLTELAPGLAAGWVLDTRGGTVTLKHTDLGIAYTQPVTAEIRDWLRIPRGEGRCLVVTGSGLNIDPTAPLPQDFRWARLRGTAAAGTVRVR